jgi:hypothetical protein
MRRLNGITDGMISIGLRNDLISERILTMHRYDSEIGVHLYPHKSGDKSTDAHILIYNYPLEGRYFLPSLTLVRRGPEINTILKKFIKSWKNWTQESCK